MSLVAREAITSTNLSPVFNIVTWVLEATTLFAVTIKVGFIYYSIGVHSDDWALLAAAFLSIGQVVAASFQSFNGIGKVQASLSDSNLITYQKAGYASGILYILSLAASKISVVLFIYHLTPFRWYRRIAISIAFVVFVWSLASVFIAAFECEHPAAYSFLGDDCIDLIAFWTSYACINMVTELALICLPLIMFHKHVISSHKKIILMFCFSLRLSVVAAIAVQMYFIYNPASSPATSTSTSSDSSNNTPDTTFATWPLLLTTQIVQSLSIITTCIPYLKTLFVGLKSGMIQTGHVSSHTLSAAGGRLLDRSSRSSPRTSRVMTSHASSGSYHRPVVRSGGGDHYYESNPGSVGNRLSSTQVLRSPTRSMTRDGRLSGSSWINYSWPSPYLGHRGFSMIAEDEENGLGHVASGALPDSNGSAARYLLNVVIPSGRFSWLEKLLESDGTGTWCKDCNCVVRCPSVCRGVQALDE